MWHPKKSGNTEARDKAANFLAHIIIRQMKGISDYLNSRFNRLSRIKQLRLLWASLIAFIALIAFTSLKFTMKDQARMMGNYHPGSIGRPSVGTPVMLIQQLTDSLTHQTKKHEKEQEQPD